MIKLFCDRCGVELDGEKMKHVMMSFNGGVDHWDFCHECAAIIKESIEQSVIKNIAEYKEYNEGENENG